MNFAVNILAAIWPWLVLPLVGYVTGSIPFGVILARLGGVNLRKVGSGNVGATNVTRAMGQRWGCLCFLLDVLKGFGPTFTAGLWLPRAYPGEQTTVAWLWLLTGTGCIMGHIYSIFLLGRGGKGVATSLGVLLGIFPFFTWPGLAAFGLWILVTRISRYVSLGSIVAMMGFVGFFYLFNADRLWDIWPMAIFATIMPMLIILKHRSNIQRLLNGTEHKIEAANKEKN